MFCDGYVLFAPDEIKHLLSLPVGTWFDPWESTSVIVGSPDVLKTISVPMDKTIKNANYSSSNNFVNFDIVEIDVETEMFKYSVHYDKTNNNLDIETSSNTTGELLWYSLSLLGGSISVEGVISIFQNK